MHLLRLDVVGADHVAPARDLALEHGAGDLGRLPAGRIELHAGLGKGVLDLGVGERMAERGVDLSMIGRGVPAGANMMCQNSRSRFL